jgi:cell division protein FtsB
VIDDLQTPRRAERARAKRPAPPRTSSRTGRLIQLGIAAVAMILVVESLFGSRGLSAMLAARRQYQSITADVDRLRAENLRLRYEAKRLREDPAAIEEAARRDLGYAAPGEKVFILRDAKPAPTTPEPAAPK